MEKLDHDIERSARKVFRLFFGSRLYVKKEAGTFEGDVIGVDMKMTYHGDKIMSLHMERRMLDSLKEHMGATESGGEVDYDFIGEMANMIAGNALTACDDGACIHPPERARALSERPRVNRKIFSSRLGKFCISIGDCGVQ